MPAIEHANGVDESILRSQLGKLREARELIDEQISVATMLLMLDELSPDAEVRDGLLDKMFETICRKG